MTPESHAAPTEQPQEWPTGQQPQSADRPVAAEAAARRSIRRHRRITGFHTSAGAPSPVRPQHAAASEPGSGQSVRSGPGYPQDGYFQGGYPQGDYSQG